MKYTDPDGRVPIKSNLSRGIKAHTTIMSYLSANYGGSPQLYLPNPSGDKKGGFFVDYERQNIQGQTEFYEVKSISYIKGNKGDIQLAGYIFRDGEAIKGTEILDEIDGIKIPFVLDAEHPNAYLTLTTANINHPGMIYYSIDNGNTQKQEVYEKSIKSLCMGLSLLFAFLGSGIINVPSFPVLEPAPVIP